MRIFPRELRVGDYDGFREEYDIFKRKEFGERLGVLFERVDDPMVVVLDAPWGSGKSAFVKMWCGEMRNNGYPVIYFDAFKNDYSNDAFTAIAGEVIALSDKLAEGAVEREKFISSSFDVAKKVVWAACKGGVKKLAEKAVGADGVEDVVDAVAQGGVCGMLDTLDDYLKERLRGRAQERLAFEGFGNALSALAEKLSVAAAANARERLGEGGALTGNNLEVGAEEKRRSLIFVIDELDRCRPPFALEILEKIKHFFSVAGVHFLLVTHVDQLENSVRYAYGIGDGADAYLQKFYNVVVRMPSGDVYNRTLASVYLDEIFRIFPDDGEGGEYSRSVKSIISKYANRLQMTFRTIEKVSTNVALVLAVTKKGQMRVLNVVCGLCVIKATHRVLYGNILNGSATLNEVCEYLGFGDAVIALADGNNEVGWWAYMLADDKMYEENVSKLVQYRDALNKYYIDDRRDVFKYLCHVVESFPFS